MNNEIERRFLFDPACNKHSVIKKLVSVGAITQGYLFVSDNRQCRVRINHEKNDCFLCYKIFKSDSERIEFEYPIPLEDGKAILESCQYKLTKRRWSGAAYGWKLDIDVFENGVHVIEIEGYFDGEPPIFCGKEVTGDRNYSNIGIAIQQAE